MTFCSARCRAKTNNKSRVRDTLKNIKFWPQGRLGQTNHWGPIYDTRTSSSYKDTLTTSSSARKDD